VQTKRLILPIIALLLAWPSMAVAQPTSIDFQQAVAAYQQSRFDAAAEKVIKLAAAMDQLPPIPEEAREHFVMGQTMFKSAKSLNDFTLAGQEFGQAVHAAPWWPEAHYNRCLALEAAGDYPGGIAALRLYLLFKLPDAEARAAQDKIYALKAKQKMAEQEKELAEAKARESSPEAIAAQEQEQFLRKINGARYRWNANSTNYDTLEVQGRTVIMKIFFLDAYGHWFDGTAGARPRWTFELVGKTLRVFLDGIAAPTVTAVVSDDGSTITINGSMGQVFKRVQ